tara:strand:+ start:3659 stop:5134 length:1476 start_codon:yes stop_codon:yes gene_type:complete
MAKLLKLRRGTTAQHGSFTGAEGEPTVDTDKDTLVIHDGSTAGGRALLREDLSNLPAGQIDNADINDDSITEVKLDISNTPTNGHFLQYKDSTDKLTWAAVSTDLVGDTTPQLGGHLDVNTKNIVFGDSADGATDDVLTFGAGTDLTIYSNGTHGVFQGDIEFNGAASDIFWDNSDNLLWFKTSSTGAQSAKAWFGDGTSAGNLEVSKSSTSALVQAHNINLQLSTATSADINLITGKDINFSNSTGVTNWYIRCLENSGSDQSVELYYGNTPTKRLETTATGVAVTGALTATDLTLSGNLVVNGTTTTVATTNTTITDNLLELNSGAGSNANDSGIIIERGSTGDNAIFVWDESEDKFIVGTTTGTADSTGNITIAAAPMVASAVEDSKGNLRSVPQNTQGSSYTLVAADAGKHILASGTITVPNSLFSAGDLVTIINNTGSDLTITKTITTMYLGTDATSTNRTLSTRGIATILFASGTVAYISGSGLS